MCVKPKYKLPKRKTIVAIIKYVLIYSSFIFCIFFLTINTILRKVNTRTIILTNPEIP